MIGAGKPLLKVLKAGVNGTADLFYNVAAGALDSSFGYFTSATQSLEISSRAILAKATANE